MSASEEQLLSQRGQLPCQCNSLQLLPVLPVSSACVIQDAVANVAHNGGWDGSLSVSLASEQRAMRAHEHLTASPFIGPAGWQGLQAWTSMVAGAKWATHCVAGSRLDERFHSLPSMPLEPVRLGCSGGNCKARTALTCALRKDRSATRRGWECGVPSTCCPTYHS